MPLSVSPRVFRYGINLWPPYLGAGIRCTTMSPDWREARVRMKLRWYNQNFVGTQFGGSLYSMTDAFYAVMLVNVLENRYWVWDKSATVEYLTPGRSQVSATFVIDDDLLNRILAGTRGGDKHLEDIVIDVINDDAKVIARIKRTLYIRLKKNTQPLLPDD